MVRKRKRPGSREAISFAFAIALASLVVLAATSSALAPSPTPSPDASFTGSIEKITPTERRWMTGESWQKGCPVPIKDLRLLRLDYHDFDGNIVSGRMVVNKKVASDVLGVFESLFDAAFPLASVDATDLYPPAERPEKRRDVSGSFNCRFIAGTRTWSQHAYGLAVDINPVQNPWVKDGKVIPRVGRPYADRSQDLPGMIHKSDIAVKEFALIGWGWGGAWSSPKDYMHFSLSGR